MCIVTNGRVVNWEPPEAIHQALTTIQDKRNKPVDPLRKKAYLRSLYSAAARLDVAGMRNAVSTYPDMVPQSDEVMALPDESFRTAATIMTQMLE